MAEKLNRTRVNYLIDIILAILFLSVAGTGLFMYFFVHSGIPRGGYILYLGLTKNMWVWIHSRAGILMVILTVTHLILHWKWIVYNTKNFFKKEKKILCVRNNVIDK